MPANGRVRHLRWLCRRGMKELDVLLERFIAEREHELGQGAWPELEALLGCEDDQLWDWVREPQAAAAADYNDLLMAIIHGPGRAH